MRRECRERFPRHRHQRKPLVSDPKMHHGTCVTHVPRCMSGSLTCGGGRNVIGIHSACTTRNFTYLVRGPCRVNFGVSLKTGSCDNTNLAKKRRHRLSLSRCHFCLHWWYRRLLVWQFSMPPSITKLVSWQISCSNKSGLGVDYESALGIMMTLWSTR